MVTREDMVEQSVTDLVRAGIEASDLSSKVHLRNAFPTEQERAQPLEITHLTERVYTITFWTFGTTATMGRTTANFVRQIVEQAGLIPLKDIRIIGQPVIDQLTLPERQAATVTRQIAGNPRPWDLFVWTTVLKVIDQYYPSQF
jgi:hypothetical protein